MSEKLPLPVAAAQAVLPLAQRLGGRASKVEKLAIGTAAILTGVAAVAAGIAQVCSAFAAEDKEPETASSHDD